MKKSIETLLYTKEPRQLDYMGLTRTELDFILANSKQQLQKVIIHNEIAFRIQTRDEAIQIPHQTKVCWGFIIPSFRKVLPTHLTPALHEFLMTCVRNVLFWDKKDWLYSDSYG
ncbi:hypothetical protein LX69_02715 [Breznakibacter xylanolyticus]|uniref:Uncharacterized protein n=1 Tax=Breznakibacter xylanolyticus TaxID=990 RepID=A0A2W7MY81_9BACT|nr:hypothetical protein [Breznakibacter xylanolyticus]PZX13055.1 hypothetical protein LX69_02715 [Breznakibacter xylanolyticus]